MSDVVLDSGILIASVFPETLTPQAKHLIKQFQQDGIELHAPNLLHYELVAVSRKAVYQERVTAEEGLRARDRLLAYPVTLHFSETLLRTGRRI